MPLNSITVFLLVNIESVFKDRINDKSWLRAVAFEKFDFISNFNAQTFEQNFLDLTRIAGHMIDIIQGYWHDRHDYIVSVKSYQGFDIYQVIDAIRLCKDNHDLQIVYPQLFELYKVFAIELGDGLPVFRQSVKKKVFLSIYKQIPEAKFEKFADKYHNIRLTLKLPNTIQNWCGFLESEAIDYDTDANELYLGDARSSKSTLVAQKVEAFTHFKFMLKTHEAVDKWLIDCGFLDKNYVWKGSKNTGKFLYGQIRWYDEMFLAGGDRRGAMSKENKEFSAEKSTNANINNINYYVMQNYSDLDRRIGGKCNLTSLMKRRGKYRMMTAYRPTPIIKYDAFGKLVDNDNFMLNDEIASQYYLDIQKSNIGNFYFSKSTCNFWNEILNMKMLQQGS